MSAFIVCFANTHMPHSHVQDKDTLIFTLEGRFVFQFFQLEYKMLNMVTGTFIIDFCTHSYYYNGGFVQHNFPKAKP